MQPSAFTNRLALAALVAVMALGMLPIAVSAPRGQRTQRGPEAPPCVRAAADRRGQLPCKLPCRRHGCPCRKRAPLSLQLDDRDDNDNSEDLARLRSYNASYSGAPSERDQPLRKPSRADVCAGAGMSPMPLYLTQLCLLI
jgi:hypothetical protein